MLEFNEVMLQHAAFTLSAHLKCEAGLVAIIGPSGGGKSTLLSAVAGFLEPSAGDILWADESLRKQSPGDRPVSILFQDNNLFPHLNILQNVGLGLDPHLRLTKSQLNAVSSVLGSVGLEGMEARKPASLSGGQQSRVALARVLLANRPVVLLDEPFAALGPALKAEMLALVQDRLIKAGKLVLMVTHDPIDAKQFANEVIVVADGVAQPPVLAQDAFRAPSPALRAYLGDK